MIGVLNKSIFIAFVASMFVHLFVWTSLYLVDKKLTAEQSKKTTVIEISIQQKNEADQTKQIVSQPKKSVNDEVPKEDSYLSRFNQSVIEETRAKNHGKFQNTARQKNTPDSSPTPKPNESKKSVTKTSKSHAAGEHFPRYRTFVGGDGPMISHLSPQFTAKPIAFPKKGFSRKELASQTDDHLKDKKISLETLLNTKEFIYFSYYERIRAKLRQYWEPKIKEKIKKIFASGRSIASSQDRVTKVIIILDKSGVLVKVQLVGKSGLTDLDDAAVEAFRSAAPFPNPPKGIIEGDGHIRIRWDFVLEA